MEMDAGKLFIGGISWDTDENKLKEYFGQYGEIIEAVIMRDRLTGRARGFGFIIFADQSVAERVVLDKHMIDGRAVEAKKAVPRDDQQIQGRNTPGIGLSPGPTTGRTKKIFVGGLASTVTESDFKSYFDQFGSVTDVVVMYDHNTQRPRGFGFITYDSEDAVDRVLHKTFHELNGKMVEVKRAVPRELSPGPTRGGSPLLGFNYGLTRGSSLVNYGQGFNLGSVRFNSLLANRTGVPAFNGPTYNMNMSMNMNLEQPGLGPGYSPNAGFGGGGGQGYGRVLGSFYGGNTNRYTTPIGYNIGSARVDQMINSSTRNVWGNGSLTQPKNPADPTFLGSGSGNIGSPSWGGISSSMASLTSNTYSNGVNNQSHVYSTTSGSLGLGFGAGDGGYGLGGRADGLALSSFNGGPRGFDTAYGDLYRGGGGGPGYGDSAWRSDESDLDGSGSFGFGIGGSSQDVVATSKSNEDFIGSYRGIAA